MPWLMKAEPDTRIVKGKDVKFSVDDFEEMGESPWDGVRSHEAKNIMKDKIKLGDKVLFYHSVYALAEISKEGYPDYTAWDPDHPYFDAKSDKNSPTWYMVSVTFIERLAYPVTLALVKSLIGLMEPPEGVAYIGEEGLKGLQGMALINRGRLSVQPVENAAYDAIVEMGRRGGFEEPAKGTKGKGKRAKEPGAEDDKPAKKANTKPPSMATAAPPNKAKAEPTEPKPRAEGSRRSSRLKK
ncbi:hypothetical protein CspHIS471_0308610 [Cutaneotrichosporon sp. HIS471]|nr:hypothetical protein CspHIS471_0308610 [Cutaneotrichosporon sp. HIS471]